MMLTAEAILNADDINKRKLYIPEWKGDVYVKTMEGTDRDRFDMVVMEQRKAYDEESKELYYRATLVVFTACDESGKLMFTKAQIPEVSKKSSTALNRITDIAQKLNGMVKEEEIEKN